MHSIGYLFGLFEPKGDALEDPHAFNYQLWKKYRSGEEMDPGVQSKGNVLNVP